MTANRRPDAPVTNSPPLIWPGRFNSGGAPVTLALVVIALVGSLQGTDPSLHSVALPAAAKALGMDASATSFIRSFGTIVLAACLLGAGILGDNHGRKKMLLTGIGIMVLASIIAAVANSAIMLGAARALMGIGTALSFSMCLAMIPSLVPKSELPRAFGIFFAVGATEIVIMTALSGTIQSALGWQWDYGAVAILAAIVGMLAWKVLPEVTTRASRKFDTPGVVLAGAGLVGLVYGIGQSATQGWASASVVVPLLACGICLTAFVVWERRTAYPGFPLELFKSRNFTAACVVGVLLNWADASILGQYPALAIPAGVSPAMVSIIVAVMYCGMIAGAAVAGWAQKQHNATPRMMFTSGMLLCSMGLLLQLLIGNAENLLVPSIGFFIIGFAVMWMQTPQGAVIMGSAPTHQTGAVAAVKPAVGQLGFGLGFAIAGPISSSFMGSKGPLTVHAYGTGLAVQAIFFVVAAVGIYLIMRKDSSHV